MVLGGAEKQKIKPVEDPQYTVDEQAGRLHRIGELKYSLQSFARLHPAHQQNVVRARNRDYHENPDETILVPGDKVREYCEGKAVERSIETHREEKYYLTGAGPMDGATRQT